MKTSEFNQLSKEEKRKVKFKDLPTINKIGVPFALFSIILLIFVLIGTCDKTKKRDTVSREKAFTAAQEFVRHGLKSPSTAKFTTADCQSTGDTLFTFDGPVDTQNSFGAMIRGSFHIKIIYNGGDPYEDKSWTVLEMYIQ